MKYPDDRAATVKDLKTIVKEVVEQAVVDISKILVRIEARIDKIEARLDKIEIG